MEQRSKKQEKISGFFEKGIDKRKRLWYNINVVAKRWQTNGSIAQLGEHLPYKQRVIGSSPIVSTIFYNRGKTPRCRNMGAGYCTHSKWGPVVQLVRTLACHARGQGFESPSGRHQKIFAEQKLFRKQLSIGKVVSDSFCLMKSKKEFELTFNGKLIHKKVLKKRAGKCLCSSVGRAGDWKSPCRWFDSDRRHH